MTNIQFPKQLHMIPRDYLAPVSGGGRLVTLDYQTRESFNYYNNGQILTKNAVVYLPAVYDGQTPSNVFYLMHGGWSNETTYLGTPDHPREFKNVLDHAMADGIMTPMIVVCPTYNNLSSNDSSDYELALALTANYYHELLHDLLPAVANRFTTYAKTSSLADLRASRDHRAFAGFSMGSVTTWRIFEHALAYFRYFFPSSGAVSNSGEELVNAVQKAGLSWHDFYIFAASGTRDFAYPEFTQQIRSMVQHYSNTFRYADNEREGNLYYLVAPAGSHSRHNALEDFYNAMIQLWKEG